jgi:hypothetical protein
MNPIFQEQLDDITAGGCQHPGCDHKSHSRTLFMHAKCHRDKPTTATIQNGVLRVACAKCWRSVADVQLKNSRIAEVNVRCSAHRNAGVFVAYEWGSGVLKIKCAECDEEFLALEVAARNTN